MAYSTLQRVALASGVVLAVSLLLPKVFLSRGKRQEPAPAPGGKRGPLPRGARHPRYLEGWGEAESPVLTCTAANPAGEGRPAAFGGCQAPQCPWRQWAGAPLAPLPCALCPRRSLLGQDCALSPVAPKGLARPLLASPSHSVSSSQAGWRAPAWDPCVGGFPVLSVVLLCVIKSVGIGVVHLNSLCGFNWMLGCSQLRTLWVYVCAF